MQMKGGEVKMENSRFKFRAWDHEDKKMWKVVAISERIWGDCEEPNVTVCDFEKDPANYETNVRVSTNYELMQCTGLTGKNGREIYEGDIVEYNDFNSLRTGGHAEDRIIRGKVFFSFGMWMVDTNNSHHDLYEGLLNDEEFEIIGNIYENPELIDVQRKRNYAS